MSQKMSLIFIQSTPSFWWLTKLYQVAAGGGGGSKCISLGLALENADLWHAWFRSYPKNIASFAGLVCQKLLDLELSEAKLDSWGSMGINDHYQL